MTFSTLMVHLDGGRSNDAVLIAAATLANEYDAKVIGIAACQPHQVGACDGYMDGDLAVIERDLVIEELARAKAEFQAHAGLTSRQVEWRSISTLTNIAQVVADQSRCADLVIIAAEPKRDDAATHADAGDLILRAGRPVLVVPDANVTSTFRTVLVAWTDTRECRRAVMDALPMLRSADRVVLVEISDDPVGAREGVADIASWLDRHGIGTDRVVLRKRESVHATIAVIAGEVEADLLVAGAYGHSRIREWAFGGVTRDLLLHERRCTLLSH